MSDGETPVRPNRRPSPLWALFIALVVAGALAASGTAWYLVEQSRALVGEGELFLTQIETVTASLQGDADDVDVAVRKARNAFELEAVSVVDPEGVVAISTSATLEGLAIDNAVLARAIAPSSGDEEVAPTFVAIALALGRPIEIDGIAEWDADAVLYHVAHPIDGGGAVLISYDLSELLGRRVVSGGIPVYAIQLVGVAIALALVAIGLMIGRSRAERTFREMETRATILENEAALLGEHNRHLSVARAEAERALALAEEKNRIRSEFVLMINHELRTPLTGVVSGAQLLREMVADETARGIIDDMISGGSRLMEMIGQMLVVARIENRGLFFEVVETPLGEIVESVRSAGRVSGVKVDPSIHVDAMTVLTDATTLPQLVASLAGNSFDHGARRVVVSCRTDLPFQPMHEVGTRPEQAMYFLIADDGPGIDPEFLPRAFEKFEKQSFSSGTGLGLYLARMMAEALDASISVYTGDRGTVMAVGVPVARTMATAS